MKISYNWLKDYLEIDKSPEQLAEDLSLFGHEAESVEKVGDDHILDLEITPNRGDCLSIIGIAREISAMYNLKLRDDTTILRSMKVSSEIRETINVKVENPKICPRFTARIINGIKIGESPEWMQKRLKSYGFRPINNIVDITNYVMIATGQLLHAFDYDKIKDGLVNIREAKEGEEVITLDGVNRKLTESAIIIEDSEKIYDLAGIMGGANSEVDQNTKTIILQGAIFDPILIRRASKKLKLVTDASYRYERGVDFEGTIRGVDMAAGLIAETCSEARIGELIDKGTKKPEDKKIELDTVCVNNLLGTNLSLEIAEEYLKRLQFDVVIVGSRLAVGVPSYRTYDIKIWQDLAEEIARMYGYNKLERNFLIKESAKENKEYELRDYLKFILSDIGFAEIYSYSFADKDKIELLGENITNCVEIANPLSPETQYLRPSLLSSLLAAAAKNPWSPETTLYEIGKVFLKDKEWWQVGLIADKKHKYYLEKFAKLYGLEKGIEVVDQRILNVYKIRRPLSYLIFDLERIDQKIYPFNIDLSANMYRPISKFPPTVRDLAFIVDDKIKAKDILEAIKQSSPEILIVELFDEYFMEENKKNLAYHIWIQDLKKPMEDGEVDQIIQDIIKNISKNYQATPRIKGEV